jgi:hypothetical protein
MIVIKHTCTVIYTIMILYQEDSFVIKQMMDTLVEYNQIMHLPCRHLIRFDSASCFPATGY